MSSVKYATVKPSGAPRTGGLGQRSDVNLSAAFATPVGTIYSEEAVKNAAIAALNGNGGPGDKIPNIGVTNGIVNDGGHMFGSVNLNFGLSPDLNTVAVGGEGLPASPYVPNLTSPGPGSTNPNDQREYAGVLPEKNDNYGFGLGAVSPAETSPKVASQTIGSYLMGRSYLGSDGKT
jgi:hypothetical protein